MIPRDAKRDGEAAPASTAGHHRPAAWAVHLAQGLAAGLGLAMIGAGAWSFLDPVGFAAWVQFPVHLHFLHDLGAFQIGIGVTLLLALLWHDALLVALGGFLVGNTLHAVSHLRDQALGGRPTDWLWLSLVSLVTLGVILLYGRYRPRLARHSPPVRPAPRPAPTPAEPMVVRPERLDPVQASAVRISNR